MSRYDQWLGINDEPYYSKRTATILMRVSWLSGAGVAAFITWFVTTILMK